MPPTEAKILSTFLLTPSPLPTIITLKAFTALFPSSPQSSPQIRALYRDLQYQRALVVDTVAHAVAAEVKRGNTQRRIVARSRARGEKQAQDDEVDIEETVFIPPPPLLPSARAIANSSQLFGSTENLATYRPHTLYSVVPALEEATALVEDEIQRLDDEAERLLEEIQGTVGGLSDLRYGKLANGKLPEQVLEGLNRLEESCQGT